MSVSVVVRLRTSRYDAATLDPRRPEWPPSPARLFSALVAASAGDPADGDVLRALESAPSPLIHASSLKDVRFDARTGFVVTNRIKAGAGSQSWPGRTNGIRERVSVVPGCDSFAIVWPTLELTDAQLGRLSRLAWRVPYVGRTTSDALVTVMPAVAPIEDGQQVWRPTKLGMASGEVTVDLPGPGYLESLMANYAAGESAARARRRRVDYRCGDEEPEPETSTEPFERQLLMLGFSPGRVPFPGEDVLAVTEGFRAAVMSRIDEYMGIVPRQVSGHGADDACHVAYLALPWVGSSHADGHLLGVAAAIPSKMDVVDRMALVQAVSTMTRLSGRRLPATELRSPTQLAPLWGLNTNRWTSKRGATRWASVTPLMLDRFPKGRNGTAEHRVAESIIRAGYPEPRTVELFPSPPVTGGITRPGSSAALRNRASRPMLHCKVTFPVPLHGPVLAGRLRYLGVGLFVPEQQEKDTNDADQ